MTMCSSYEMLGCGLRKSLITLFQSSAVKMLKFSFFALSILPKSVSLVRNQCPLSKKVCVQLWMWLDWHMYIKKATFVLFLFWPQQRSLKLWISKYLERSIDWRNANRQEATSLLPLFPSVSYQIHICPLLLWRVFLPKLYRHICRL